jgi:hypothetical protein
MQTAKVSAAANVIDEARLGIVTPLQGGNNLMRAQPRRHASTVQCGASQSSRNEDRAKEATVYRQAMFDRPVPAGRV